MGAGETRRRGLWRNGDFLKLWAGETTSHLGTQVTTLALPLTAVLLLDATSSEMGLLTAAAFAPFLLVALPAGVLIDRVRRRPILIGANLGRALLLGMVPLLAALDLLRLGGLVAIAFLAGILTVLFQLAYQSYLPTLIAREELVEGNSKLSASESVAQIGGPGIGGLLVQLLTAPVALLFDAASFLAAALATSLIRAREPEPVRLPGRAPILAEIAEGLRIVSGNRYLRAIAGEAATYNLCYSAIYTIQVLYMVRELGLAPGLVGAILGLGSVGALLGAFVAGPSARRLGIGPTLLWAVGLGSASPLLIPLAGGPRPVVAGVLATAAFLTGLGLTATNVNAISLRQTLTPANLLGRMNASYRFLISGTIPLGALLGGVLGDALGLRAALLVGASGLITAWLWIALTPVRGLRTLPDTAPVVSAPPRAIDDRATGAAD